MGLSKSERKRTVRDRRRFPVQRGDPAARELEGPEQQRHIPEVAQERIPEERDGRHIALDEAGGGAGIEGKVSEPRPEIRHHEEQHRSRDGGPDSLRHTPMVTEPEADAGDRREAAVDPDHAVMETEDRIAEKHGGNRDEKGGPPVEIHRAEQCYRRYRREVGRMRQQARKCRGEHQDEHRDKSGHRDILPNMMVSSHERRYCVCSMRGG